MSWGLGIFLAERVVSETISPSERANKRFTRWLKHLQSPEHDSLKNFLDTHGMTEDQFKAVLDQSIESLNQDTPTWAKNFIDRSHNISKTSPARPPYLSQKAFEILTPVWGLIHRYASELQDFYEARPSDRAILKASVIDIFVLIAARRLIPVLQRTLVLEVNIAKMRGDLNGATEEERFSDFIRTLTSIERQLALFEQYPVLARRVQMILDHAQEFLKELIERFDLDFSEILALSKSADDVQITDISTSGDTHARGRAVALISLSNGKKVVYKPHSLSIDNAIGQFIHWLASTSELPELRCAKVIDKKDYGWTEFIEFASCKDLNEVHLFYRRQGIWLAILNLLGATDLHLENVIANGAHPVVVDFEAMLHPPPFDQFGLTATDEATRLMNDSVLALGLLPAPRMINGVRVDISAMGAAEQEMPYNIDQISGWGSTEVSVVKAVNKLQGVRSRPQLDGKIVAAEDFYDDVIAGFTESYRILQKHRNLLEQSDSPLQPFKRAIVRIVARPTSFYSKLIYDSDHPSALGDSLEKELHFAKLWPQTTLRPELLNIIKSEYEQLIQGDIPYFYTTPDSTEVHAEKSGPAFVFLARSGWQRLMSRLASMGEEDLERQIWFVRASLYSLRLPPKRQHEPLPKRFSSGLELAGFIGETLCRSAVRSNGSATWLGLRFTPKMHDDEDGRYFVGVLGSEFYNGLSGVAFFLAYLAEVQKNERFKTIAREAWQTVVKYALKEPLGVGAYLGLTGIVYTAMHLAKLWRTSEPIDLAASLLPRLTSSISNEQNIDFVSGLAGAAVVLAQLEHHLRDGRAIDLARQCAEKLLDKNAWAKLEMPRGLSHGLSGIAYGLFSVAIATGDDRYNHAAREALDEERQLIANGIWTDIPGNEQGVTWCHGAPGMSLIRMAMFAEKKDPALKAEIEEMLALQMQRAPLSDHTICHGALGNFEPMIVAAKILPDYCNWRPEIQARLDQTIDSICKSGWQSPLPPTMIPPGIMTGLAGVGYGLLRAEKPEQVPSMLTLAPA